MVGESGEMPADARLRLTLQAFCERHEPVWRAFAVLQVASEQDAALVLKATREHLQRNWALALRQEIPAAYAWLLLKEHLACWLPHTGPQPPAPADVVPLAAALCRATGLPEGTDLAPAILKLPERQHDVLALKHLLHLAEPEIAEYLGRPVATVRSTLRHARRNLARLLGLPDQALEGSE